MAKPGEPQDVISFFTLISFRLSCTHFFLSIFICFQVCFQVFLCLYHTSLRSTWLSFDRPRHIFFGIVNQSQDTPCNNTIRSASPRVLRITNHAPLSSTSVDIKYCIKYPYVTCRFVQRCTRQIAPLPAAVLKSMHLIEKFLE